MTTATATATAGDLAAMLSSRSVKYPCEVATRMRNAARLLWSCDGANLLVASWILTDALQYATQTSDPRLTPARVRWLCAAIDRVKTL